MKTAALIATLAGFALSQPAGATLEPSQPPTYLRSHLTPTLLAQETPRGNDMVTVYFIRGGFYRASHQAG